MEEEGKIYKAGIIGCGRIASTIEDEVREAPGFGLFPYTHAGVYERNPRTELVAATDVSEERLHAFGERWGVAALYNDAAEMLEREDLDIVSIAASSGVHHPLTMEVVKYPVQGIFLEKPVARSLHEADEMVAACREAGIEVVVNHTRTFDPYYRAAKDLIDGGEIGELRAVMSTWKEGFSFGGSHLFDLLRYMVQADADWVFCHMDEDDSLPDPGGDAYIAYANGVRAHIHMPFKTAAPAAVEFIGSEGMIRLGTYRFQWWKVEQVGSRRVIAERPFPGRHTGKSGMYTAVEELIRAIETGERPASTLEDGRTALEITVALRLAGRRGEVVELPVTETGHLVETFA